MSIFKKRGSKSKSNDKIATDSLSLEALDSVVGGAAAATNKQEEHPMTGGGLLAPPQAVAVAVLDNHAATNQVAASDAAQLNSGQMDAAHAIAHVEQFATSHNVSELSALTALLSQSHGNAQVAASLTSQLNSSELAHDLANLVKAGHMTNDQVTGELSNAVKALQASSADHTALRVDGDMALNKAYALLYNAAGDVGATGLLQHLTSGANDLMVQHGLVQLEADYNADLVNSGKMTVAAALADLAAESAARHIDRETAFAELLVQTNGNPAVYQALADRVLSGTAAHDLVDLYGDKRAAAAISDVIDTLAQVSANHTVGGLPADLAIARAYAQLWNEARAAHLPGLQAALTATNNYEVQVGLIGLELDAAGAARMSVGDAFNTAVNRAMAHGMPKDLGIMHLIYATNGNPDVINAALGRLNSGAVADDLNKFYVGPGSMSTEQAMQAVFDITHAIALESSTHKVGKLNETLATNKLIAEVYDYAGAVAARDPANALRLQAMQTHIALNHLEQAREGWVGVQIAWDVSLVNKGQMTTAALLNDVTTQCVLQNMPKEVGLAYAVQLTNGDATLVNNLTNRLLNGTATSELVNSWLKNGAAWNNTPPTVDRAVSILFDAIDALSAVQRPLGMNPEMAKAFLIANLYNAATGTSGNAVRDALQANFAPELASGKDMADYYNRTKSNPQWPTLLYNHAQEILPAYQRAVQASHAEVAPPPVISVASHVTDLTSQVLNTNSQSAVTALTKEIADGTTQTELINLVKAGKITGAQAVDALTKAIGALAAESNDHNTIGGVPQETALNKAELKLYELAQQLGATALTAHLDANQADDLAAARAEAAAEQAGIEVLNRANTFAARWITPLDGGSDPQGYSADTQARIRMVGGGLAVVFWVDIAEQAKGLGRDLAVSRLSQSLFSIYSGSPVAELGDAIRNHTMTAAQAVDVLHHAVDAIAKSTPNHLVGGLPPDLAFAKVEAMLYNRALADEWQNPGAAQRLLSADFAEVTTGLALLQAQSAATMINANLTSVASVVADLTAFCQGKQANVDAALTQLLISTQGKAEVYQVLLSHLTSGQLSNNVALSATRETTLDGHGVAVMTSQQGIALVLDVVSTLARFSPDGKVGGLTPDMAADRALAQLYDAAAMQPQLRAELVATHAADLRDGHFINGIGAMMPTGAAASNPTAVRDAIDAALTEARTAGMSAETSLTILLSAGRNAGNALMQDQVTSRLTDTWAAADAAKLSAGTMTAAQAVQDVETRAQSLGICGTVAVIGLLNATKGNAGVTAELTKDISEGTINGDLMRAVSAGNLSAVQAGQVLAQAVSALAKYSADHMVLGQTEIAAENASLAKLYDAATAQGATALAAILLAAYKPEIEGGRLAAIAAADAARINSGVYSASDAVAHITSEAASRGISPVVSLTELLIDTKGNATVVAALVRALAGQGLGVLPQLGAGLSAAEQQVATAILAAQTVEALVAAVDAVVRLSPNHTLDGAPRDLAVGKLLAQLQGAAGTSSAVTAYLGASHAYDVRVGTVLAFSESLAAQVANGSVSPTDAINRMPAQTTAAGLPNAFGLMELLHAANRAAEASGRPVNATLVSSIIGTLTTSMMNSTATAEAFDTLVKQGKIPADRAADAIATMAEVLATRAAGDKLGSIPDAAAADVAMARLYNTAVQTGNTALQQALLAQHAGDARDGNTMLYSIDLAGRIGSSLTIAQAIAAAEGKAAEHKTSMLGELISLAAVTTGANLTAVKAEITKLLSTDAGERDLVQAVGKGWVAASDASAVIKAATAAAGVSQNDIENTYAQLWTIAGTANAPALQAYLKEHDTMLTGAGLARTWSADAIRALNSSTALVGGTPDSVYRTGADNALSTAITKALDFGVPRLVVLTQIMEDLRAQCGPVQQLGPNGPFQGLMGVDSLHLSTRTMGIDYRPYIMMEEAFRLANLAQQGEQELAGAVSRGVLSPKGALAALDDFIAAANATYSGSAHLELQWVNQTYARLCRDGNVELQQELKLNHATQLESGFFQLFREGREFTPPGLTQNSSAEEVNGSIAALYAKADVMHASHTQVLIYLLGESQGNRQVAAALGDNMFGVNGSAAADVLIELGRGTSTAQGAIDKLANQVHLLYSAVGTGTMVVSGVTLTEAQAIDVVDAKLYREASKAGDTTLTALLQATKLAEVNIGWQLLMRQEAHNDADKVASGQMTIQQAIAHVHAVAVEAGTRSPAIDASEEIGLIELLTATGNNAMVAAALSQRLTSGAAEAELATLAKQGILSQAQALQVIADATDALSRAGALRVPRDDFYNSAVGRLYLATSDVNDPSMASFLIAREAAHINAGNQALVRDLAEQVKAQPIANAIAQVEAFAAKALVSVEWGLVQLLGRTQGASTTAVAAELTTRLTGALPVTDLPMLAGLGQLTDVAAARDLQALSQKGAMTAAQILQLGHDAVDAVMRAAPSALHMTADQAFDILGARLAVDAGNANNTALMRAVQASDREVASLSRDQQIVETYGAAFRNQVAGWLGATGNLADRMADATVENALAGLIKSGQVTGALAMQAINDVVHGAASSIPSGWGLTEAQLQDAAKLRLYSRVQGTDLELWMESRFAADISRATNSSVVGKLDVAAVGAGYMTATEAVADFMGIVQATNPSTPMPTLTRFYQDAASQPVVQSMLASNMASFAVDAALRTSVPGLTVPAGGDAFAALAARVAQGSMTPEAAHQALVAASTVASGQLSGLGVNRVSAGLAADIAEARLYDAAVAAHNNALVTFYQTEHPFAVQIGHMALADGATPYMTKLLGVEQEVERIASWIDSGRMPAADAVTYMTNYANTNQIPIAVALAGLAAESHGNATVAAALGQRLGDFNTTVQLVDLVQAGQITPDLARDIVGNAARLAWPNSPDKVQYDLASINAGLRANELRDALAAHTVTPQQAIQEALNFDPGAGFISRNDAGVAVDPRTEGSHGEHKYAFFGELALALLANESNDQAVKEEAGRRLGHGEFSQDILNVVRDGTVSPAEAVAFINVASQLMSPGSREFALCTALARLELQALAIPALPALSAYIEADQHRLEQVMQGLGTLISAETNASNESRMRNCVEHLLSLPMTHPAGGLPSQISDSSSGPGDGTRALNLLMDAMLAASFPLVGAFIRGEQMANSFIWGATTGAGYVAQYAPTLWNTAQDSSTLAGILGHEVIDQKGKNIDGWVHFGAQVAATGVPLGGPLGGILSPAVAQVTGASFQGQLLAMGTGEASAGLYFTAVNVASAAMLFGLQQKVVADVLGPIATGTLKGVLTLISVHCQTFSGLISAGIQAGAQTALDIGRNTTESFMALSRNDMSGATAKAEAAGDLLFRSTFGASLNSYVDTGRSLGNVVVSLFSGDVDRVGDNCRALGADVVNMLGTNPALVKAYQVIKDQSARVADALHLSYVGGVFQDIGNQIGDAIGGLVGGGGIEEGHNRRAQEWAVQQTAVETDRWSHLSQHDRFAAYQEYFNRVPNHLSWFDYDKVRSGQGGAIPSNIWSPPPYQGR